MDDKYSEWLMKLLAWGTASGLLLVGWILQSTADVFDIRAGLDSLDSKEFHASVGILLLVPIVYAVWAKACYRLYENTTNFPFSVKEIRSYTLLLPGLVIFVVILAIL